MDVSVLADHKIKIKQSENIGIYLDLARELKKGGGYKGDGETSCS